MKKQLKEKRKKRIVDGKVTLTTYKRFKKRFPTSLYNRKTKSYGIIPPEKFVEIKQRRKRKKPTQKRETERIPIEEQKFILRKQVVLNLRGNNEPYAVSVRAITTNPIITERGLKLAVIEVLKDESFNLSDFDLKKEWGYASQYVPSNSDPRLKDQKIHVEIQIRRERPINFIK